MLCLYFENQKNKILNQKKVLHQNARKMTDDEENVLLELCLKFAAMGYSINRNTLLEMINIIIGPDSEDSNEDVLMFVPATMETVRGVLRRKEVIAKLVHANSMDRQRADNASIETRNHHFTKLDNYASLIQKISNKSYGSKISDWPSDSLYNMDEVAIDITSHRNKVIAGKDCDRIFAVSREGDGKMTRHTTLAITS
jgi:hypothetical protein